MRKILIGTVGLIFAATGAVFAASSMELANSQLQVKTANGNSYVSGGFGVDERENLRAISKDENLELSFALQNKEYLGGANVIIKDSKGRDVLQAVSDGPLFFAQLPEGTYTLEATTSRKTLKQVVHVPAKEQARVYFAWRSVDEPATQAMAQQ
jgi:hypothetical protein